MRTLAAVLVAVGIATMVAGPFYASSQSADRYQAWLNRDADAAARFDVEGMKRRMLMLQGELSGTDPARPEWTVVSPWPIVGTGAVLAAFGILILAVRRPLREAAR